MSAQTSKEQLYREMLIRVRNSPTPYALRFDIDKLLDSTAPETKAESPVETGAPMDPPWAEDPENPAVQCQPTAEMRKLLSIAHLAERLDKVICEFGTEPAYIAEAAQALHDVLNGGRGFYQVCNVCGGVPVPGTGRCKTHTDETGCSPLCERLRDCEISLGAFDPGATSEYWLKYGSRASETSVRLYSEKDVAAITAAALAARRAKEITYEQVAEVHSGCLRWTLPFGDPGYEMGNYPLYRRALKANCFTNPDPAASTGASEPQPPLGSSSAAGSDLPDRILKEPQ